jgi:hypothetical protein
MQQSLNLVNCSQQSTPGMLDAAIFNPRKALLWVKWNDQSVDIIMASMTLWGGNYKFLENCKHLLMAVSSA